MRKHRGEDHVFENAEKRIETQQSSQRGADNVYGGSIRAGVCGDGADIFVFHGLLAHRGDIVVFRYQVYYRFPPMQDRQQARSCR